MTETCVQLYVVISGTYATFRLVMFGHHEEELRPAAMPRLRYALAAGVAAVLGGAAWPATLVSFAVRAAWNKIKGSR